MRQPSAALQRKRIFQRAKVERRPRGKQGIGEQVFFDGRQLVRQRVERNPMQRMDPRNAEQKSQSDDVVQVGVGQKDIEVRGLEILACPIGGGPGVQHHAALRQQQARRLPPVVRMVAGCAEQKESHGRLVGSE
jgi:hypothetical protein